MHVAQGHAGHLAPRNLKVYGVSCGWAHLRKYGQLTDITGRPISRASSASSAQTFQARPSDIQRSLTRDTELSSSGSESDSDEQLELVEPEAGFAAAAPSKARVGRGNLRGI